MSSKTLPREPWRGSMICGYQISSGGWGHPMAFCAERKADGLPMCEACFDDVLEEYGVVEMAPGNVLGNDHGALRLLWEGEDPEVPIEASASEMARYAGILA